MTTVEAAGQPQTSPVWFHIDDEVSVVYSADKMPRTRDIRSDPKVCLNLDSTHSGSEVVITEGTAEVVESVPATNEHDGCVAEHEESMAALGMTPGSFAADYPARIHVQPTRLRAC